ncbi:MAG: 3'-5' exonuclease [Bacteroidaceae bacterium]|nr:3'-5' exonuclease [Bacteroidaceae bacterium]
MQDINFIAIDFETATSSRNSICEAGICVVRNGRIVETRSWLVRPKNNYYHPINTGIHGICPEDTKDAPDFPTVWNEILEYIHESSTLVAHNAAFDMGCIRSSLEYHGMKKENIDYFCTFQIARRIYGFKCNKLNALCDHFGIDYDRHHRAGDDARMCAELFLQEIKDTGVTSLEMIDFGRGKL